MTITIFRQGSKLAGGRYVLERRLGAGGMATVWLAQDTRLQRGVAVKLPSDALLADPTFARRFEREAMTAAGLSHPNLVSVYDYGTEGDRPYLVSEFIDGPSLAQLCEVGKCPAIEPLAQSLLAALGHIHSSGIVHRDIKPANVLVEGERILLTDFGIAQSTEETSLTKTGNVIGTYDYLAPEVRRGARATPASDLYACGVLLSKQITTDDPDRYHRLVERLTADDPADRPAGAEDALEMIVPADSVTAVITAEDPTPVTVEQPVSAPTAEAPAPLPPSRVLDESARLTSPREAPPPSRGGKGSPLGKIALGLAGVALAVIAVVAIAGGGGEDEPSRNQAAAKEASGGGGGSGSEETTSEEPAPEETTEDESTVPVDSEPVAEVPTGGDDPAAGTELNDQGYALLQQGDFEGALPLLEEAVASFPEDSTDPNYAYALFNYAQALRETGNPEAAIPLLEKRLSFSDDRTEIVEAELALAQEAAGE